MAHKTGAIGPKDLERDAVDTTVLPRAVAHPSLRLMHRAITSLVGLAKHSRVPLPQSHLRVPTRIAIMVRRYISMLTSSNAPGTIQVPAGTASPDGPRHPSQDWWQCGAGRSLRPLLGLAQEVRSQDQHQRSLKVYALHEYNGKGKDAHLRV